MHGERVPTGPPVPPARLTRPIAVILRLVPAAARDGRIAGQLEVVDTGETVPVRSADELVRFLQRLAAEE